MTKHVTGTREKWLAARLELLRRSARGFRANFRAAVCCQRDADDRLLCVHVGDGRD
jgi:hypothetical protein